MILSFLIPWKAASIFLLVFLSPTPSNGWFWIAVSFLPPWCRVFLSLSPPRCQSVVRVESDGRKAARLGPAGRLTVLQVCSTFTPVCAFFRNVRAVLPNRAIPPRKGRRQPWPPVQRVFFVFWFNKFKIISFPLFFFFKLTREQKGTFADHTRSFCYYSF